MMEIIKISNMIDKMDKDQVLYELTEGIRQIEGYEGFDLVKIDNGLYKYLNDL